MITTKKYIIEGYIIDNKSSILIEAENTKDIKVENEGILELGNKSFEETPKSHFISLAKKIGKGPVSKAINNISRWASEKNPSLSKKASDMMDSLKNDSEWQDIEAKKESYNYTIPNRIVESYTSNIDYYNEESIIKLFYDYIWGNILYDLQGTDIATNFDTKKLFEPRYLKEVALELYLDYAHKDKVNHGRIDKYYDAKNVVYNYLDDEREDKHSILNKLVNV